MNVRAAPLRAIVRRSPPVAEFCELSCGHIKRHRVGEVCSSRSHYCASCEQKSLLRVV